MSRLIEVSLDKLDEGTNVRSSVDASLKRSILEHGVLQPITVAANGKRYTILYGHRRAAAARAAGLRTIPALLEDEPADLPIRQLIENQQRRSVDPIDVATTIRDYLDAHPGMTQADIATALDRSGYWVSAKLALLRMDPETQRRVKAGEIRGDQAYDAQRAGMVDGRRTRSRILQPVEEGRSASVVVELAGGKAGNKRQRATIGIERDVAMVDLVIEDGSSSVMLSLSPAMAKLLALRLNQASQALAAVAS